ncbi:MAG: histidinol dehydrogenase [Actinomycetota bacterium]|jgi:histidinol dehydrogenase
MANVLRRMEWTAMSPDQRDALCRRGLDDIFDPALRESIGALIEDVRTRGDRAVCDALARFDGITLRPDQLRVTANEIASATIDPAVEAAIIDAISHLRAFNDELMERASDWQIEIENGLVAGEKISPIASVGLFVPSGKASYPSVAYQLGVPAMVAGVPNVVLVVPPVPGGNGEVDPAVLVVCRLLGITNVFRINGPAGIAALGFGTESIPRVRKVVGPGSPAVTIAQVEMQRHGLATMMLLGPTESLVLTDHTADPVRLAADLLIEAEHGTDSTVVLVTPSAELVDLVDDELERQLADLPPVRADAARASLGVNGGAVITDNMNDAVDVANTFAAEHLQVIVDPRHEEAVVDALVNAGEILIGQDTPFSAANFVIGCPASLPTSGFAHVSSGITVEAFLKRTAVARANESALRRMSNSIVALADHEGFPAHGNAIRRRFG